MIGDRIESREELVKVLADEFESCMEESYPVVDLTAQTVTQVIDSAYAEPDANEHLDGHEIVAFDPLTSRESYRIMEKFAWSRPEEQSRRLLDAISQRHPFRMFDGAVNRMGIADEWHEWRHETIRNHAADLLEAYGVEFKDGEIVCNNKKNIRTYLCDD